ncbi:MAG TPA: hypothetical protein VL947_05040, partial [Cytophagales bacterium]|nr:hypothetical protein [Cytophagales bacterium]
AYTYHSNGQLKERVLFFGETPDSYYAEHNNIFILYTYAYDAKGRIASDTNHYIGGLAIDSNRSIQSYTEYTYDDKNRIVSEKIVFPRWNFSQVNTYEYGADGNLVGGVYDKNVNPLRLSKVLAFIAKDYSVNNRTGDDLTYEYNKYKLPVKITGSSNVLAGHYGAGTFNITYIKK